MPTSLPTDSNNNPIPALGLKDSGAHKLTVSATSSRNTTAFASDTQIISLYATVPVYIRFGDFGVTATTSDHYFRLVTTMISRSEEMALRIKRT